MLRLRDRVKDSIEFHSATIRALIKRWGWLIWKKIEEVGKKRTEGLISDWQGMREIYHLPRHLNFSNTRHDTSPCPTPNPTFSTFSAPPPPPLLEIRYKIPTAKPAMPSHNDVQITSCSACQNHHTSLNRCSRCRAVAYCSKDCQSAHWPTHKSDCKRPNYILEAHVLPNDITNPPVKRVLSRPARATFYELHRALQVVFGWAGTHDWDFVVNDPEYPGPESGEAEMVELMRKIMRHNSRISGSNSPEEEAANDPREYLVRIKVPQDRNTMMPFVDSGMGNMARAHPRTPEKNAGRVKLFEVFDKEEYRGLEYAYTYDFGDNWEHVVKIVGRAPATDNFSCTGGEGKGIAEDVGGFNGWEKLKAAYRTDNPDKDQRGKMKWFETQASNADRDGLGGSRVARWSKAEVNRGLAECGL